MIARVVACIVFLVSCGCASVPPKSPQESVAKYGGDVIASVGIVQKALITMKLPEASVAAAMVIFDKIGMAGQRLSQLLALYDAAAEGVARIQAAKDVGTQLELIDGLLLQVLTPLTTEESRAQISKLLSNTFNLILLVKGAVSSLKPAGALSIHLEVVPCLA